MSSWRGSTRRSHVARRSSRVREVFLAARAEAQIVDVLAYTLERFGTRKHDEYRGLIAEGLSALAEDAESGKRRPDIHPDAWTHHITQPGRRARHLFLYRIRDRVEVACFLHDGMDLPGKWPSTWSGSR